MTVELLITGGCSYSDVRTTTQTWPVHLNDFLKLGSNHIKTGLVSQGNGLISRRIVYEVSQALKTHSADKLLVAVMWSSPDRHDYYDSRENIFTHNVDGWKQNPTKFITESKTNWVLLNWHWNNPLAKQYYTQFHDQIGSLIYSYEHILRTQWFLKLHGIKYFMSSHTVEAFPKNFLDHVDVKHLYEQINFDQFLPVDGEYEWCRDYSGLEFSEHDLSHPTSEQHKLFTNHVIIPFLERKNYV